MIGEEDRTGMLAHVVAQWYVVVISASSPTTCSRAAAVLLEASSTNCTTGWKQQHLSGRGSREWRPPTWADRYPIRQNHLWQPAMLLQSRSIAPGARPAAEHRSEQGKF
jgi:hypothetical protein